MKRKYQEVEEGIAKKAKDSGHFSLLQKRKNEFEMPHAKRYHAYSIVEEKDRHIAKLENIIKGMMCKIDELEYQLKVSRCISDTTIHNNRLIESF